ncbi:AAA family ATPase [Agarivorans sp. TSD2052]|uniref:AAA family ATPase n=1 Tax=Agarivorans sp. TSD2052 TaxID=2937286 RepID=UPI00200CF73E|nr:AAA family ATPase [Agarivorans sp. TSD2052]UPW18675.1 AAA family ATPase [Agarivorans sp. TSD2052]
MKTLLLFTKYIALQEKASAIYEEHLGAAYLCLAGYAVDREMDVFKKLSECFKLPPFDCFKLAEEYAATLSYSALEQAKSATVLPFSKQVSEILEKINPPLEPSSWIEQMKLFELPTGGAAYRDKLAKLEQVKTGLLEEVYGQDHAVEHLIDNVASSLWHGRRDKPKGVFLFAGPPASGKTYLAERFAKQLGDEYQYKLFDMTHYTNSNEVFGLVGAKKTYDDSAPGQLTEFVKQNPKSVLVFDELEKAHTQVLMGFLSLLSSGWMTDEYTEQAIDFRDTIIIFTSNLGRAVYGKKEYLQAIETSPAKARAALIEQLRKETKIERGREVQAVPPELLSRLSQGSVLLFKTLGWAELMRVAIRQLENDLQAFSQLSQIKFDVLADELSHLLVMSFSPLFDIRDIKANISSKLIDPITDFLRRNTRSEIKSIRISLATDLVNFLTVDDKEAQFKSLRTRHEVFSFSAHCQLDGTKLNVQLSSPSLDVLLRAEDVEVSGGIVIDLPNISFSDIAGHDVVKRRLTEIISIIKNQDTLAEQGIIAPKGMVLYGPPGTGKTTLARALASEAGLPMISCSGNDLLSTSFIEKLFERARKYAPCIVFIDEIDALPKRGQAGPMADALTNRLLVEIDGFNQASEPVFIVAATNLVDKLDDALLRSGRLDLQLEVPYLDKGARLWFIHRFLANDCYEKDINPELIVSLTAGCSGADLEKIHRESVLRSLTEGNRKIDQTALIEQVNILKYGVKRSQDSCEKSLAETAYHEAGHAVLSKILVPERDIEQVSIVPREKTLGMVAYNNDQKIDYTKSFWFSLTCIALAGRAAQVKQFADDGLDTGASSDLRQAMHCAWMAIARYGMHPDSYNLDINAIQELAGESYFKQQTENLIKSWIDDASAETDKLTRDHWPQIEAVATALLEREVLSEAELIELMQASIK